MLFLTLRKYLVANLSLSVFTFAFEKWGKENGLSFWRDQNCKNKITKK